MQIPTALMHTETSPLQPFTVVHGIASLPIPTQHSITTHNPHGGRGINNHTDNRPGRDTTQGIFLPEPDVGIYGVEFRPLEWIQPNHTVQEERKISKNHSIASIEWGKYCAWDIIIAKEINWYLMVSWNTFLAETMDPRAESLISRRVLSELDCGPVRFLLWRILNHRATTAGDPNSVTVLRNGFIRKR